MLWILLIIFGLIIELIGAWIIVYNLFQIFKNSFWVDKIFIVLITFLFLVALSFGVLFVKAINAKWNQSPILAVPLFFVLLKSFANYIYYLNADNSNNPRILIKHYFNLCKIIGMSYIISVLLYSGFDNIFNFPYISNFELSSVCIFITIIVFVLTYFISYGFLVYVFSKGHKMCASKRYLKKIIQRNENQYN